MKKRYAPDYGLLIGIFLVVAFGLAMLSTLSVYQSEKKVSESKVREYCLEHPEFINCTEEEGRRYVQELCFHNGSECNSLYLKRQVQSALIGVVAFIVAFFLPVALWHTLAPLIFLIAFILLILVFTPLGSDYGTARSWLNIPVLRSVQPVEIAKIAIIFYFAIWMSKKQNEIQTFQGGFVPFVILVSLMIVPVAFQPDFGSVLVLGFIATAMFFTAGGNIWHILGGGILASLLAWPVILSKDYIRNRFKSLFFPELANENDRYQIDQSLMGIGSGKWTGTGLEAGTQDRGYLPEIQGDFIFSGIAEKMGFLRMSILLFLFLFIAMRGLRIARNAPDRFSFLIATGITSWFIFQSIINILVTMGLFPLTGITLPLLSFGGSSLVMILFALGILLNISTLSPQIPSTNSKNYRGIYEGYS